MLSPLPQTIPHAAEAAARQWPDAPAIVEGDLTISFAELWDLSRAAASSLLARGVKAGDRIAIWAPNRHEWIVAAIATMAIGAAVVTLNTRLKGREAGDILRRTKARTLFTVSDFLGIDYRALIAEEDLPDLTETIVFDNDFATFLEGGKGSSDTAG
jgi:HIP---CoA ligase